MKYNLVSLESPSHSHEYRVPLNLMVTDTEDILFSITDKVGDIDECELYPNKLCSHICVNTVGSYRCECPNGYSLHTDESTCIRDQDSRKLMIKNTLIIICLIQ